MSIFFKCYDFVLFYLFHVMVALKLKCARSTTLTLRSLFTFAHFSPTDSPAVRTKALDRWKQKVRRAEAAVPEGKRGFQVGCRKCVKAGFCGKQDGLKWT